MTDIALFAFARAWLTTLIATSLLTAMLAGFRIWQSSACEQELATVLGLDIWNAPI